MAYPALSMVHGVSSALYGAQGSQATDPFQRSDRGNPGHGNPPHRTNIMTVPTPRRPGLEAEFLVTEKLAPGRRNWKTHVDRGRQGFEERQLRAAVRRHPEIALAILREEGHIT